MIWQNNYFWAQIPIRRYIYILLPPKGFAIFAPFTWSMDNHHRTHRSVIKAQHTMNSFFRALTNTIFINHATLNKMQSGWKFKCDAASSVSVTKVGAILKLNPNLQCACSMARILWLISPILYWYLMNTLITPWKLCVDLIISNN